MNLHSFAYIGALFVIYCLLKLGWNFFHLFRVYFYSDFPDFSKFGKWSVVTGSTDGIGKAVALQLAERGQNIILVARNDEKLKKTAAEIDSKYGVKTKCLKVDFSNDEAIYDVIKKFLDGYDIGVLVNNVGTGTMPMPFLDVIKHMPNILTTIMRINVISVVKMTEIVLPGMVNRRRGLIINVSSQSAIRPLMLSIYGSTKAFMDYFTRTLSLEYESKGITIQSCLPSYVKTNMTKAVSEKENPLRHIAMKSDDYAKSLLNTVNKERVTYGCWKHAVQAWLILLLPDFLYVPMMKKGTANLLKSLKKKT